MLLSPFLHGRLPPGLVEPAILDRIDEIALLIRRFGLAAFLERLELAVQEL